MLGDDEWYSDGLAVGMEEGLRDGLLLRDGDNVGDTLGCKEGTTESLGISLGKMLGCKEGTTDSLGISDDNVGDVVGNLEGISEYAIDGPDEGFTLGPSDGALVIVGTLVLDCDGLLVENLS